MQYPPPPLWHSPCPHWKAVQRLVLLVRSSPSHSLFVSRLPCFTHSFRSLPHPLPFGLPLSSLSLSLSLSLSTFPAPQVPHPTSSLCCTSTSPPCHLHFPSPSCLPRSLFSPLLVAQSPRRFGTLCLLDKATPWHMP